LQGRRHLGIDHAHVAFEQALHPFVAVAVHEGAEPGASFRRSFDYDRVNDPGSDEPDQAARSGRLRAVMGFESLFSGMLPAWEAGFNRTA
jgi:hypothetical protein